MEQNRTQNETKFKTIFEMQKVTLQDRLGAVLDRFGRTPGCHLSCLSIGFYMISCKSTLSNKVGVQERSGRRKRKKRDDLGSQNGVKINEESMSNIDRNFDRLLGAQEASLNFSRSLGGEGYWSAGGRGAAPPRYLTFGKYHRFEESKNLNTLSVQEFELG